tara:strand:+ start:195 stop:497 length:303 start_codon:yes stop_codon:yes gene_type:complete
MAAKANTIGDTAKNKLIQELINVGYVKSLSKSSLNLSRASNYKPNLDIPTLQKAMKEGKAINGKFRGQMQQDFAIKLVNLLKDKHGVISKARGILPIIES